MFGISFSKIVVMVLAIMSIFVLWRSIRLIQGYFANRRSAVRHDCESEPRIMDLITCPTCGAYTTSIQTVCGKCGGNLK